MFSSSRVLGNIESAGHFATPTSLDECSRPVFWRSFLSMKQFYAVEFEGGIFIPQDRVLANSLIIVVIQEECAS
ncbi:hypothetical protein CS022_04755 [Veronia nyctiphanis]|uniref:Uncharacterized protein n=1 Tax=Veronia nyctiphanis TaxID=1278244 RepID=A0A4V1LT89_9GAMM|nr:hypothetical protein CS022_04755 [Veronia nyctiphanis]